MIELKNVTTRTAEGEEGLGNYSRIIHNGEFCQLPEPEGRLVINALLGFNPVTEGFISFDGMVLSSRSVSFLRKKMTFVPMPDGFDDAHDLARKQLEMIEESIKSEADILLAINPTCYQDELQSASIINRLQQRTTEGRIVVMSN